MIDLIFKDGPDGLVVATARINTPTAENQPNNHWRCECELTGDYWQESFSASGDNPILAIFMAVDFIRNVLEKKLSSVYLEGCPIWMALPRKVSTSGGKNTYDEVIRYMYSLLPKDQDVD